MQYARAGAHQKEKEKSGEFHLHTKIRDQNDAVRDINII